MPEIASISEIRDFMNTQPHCVIATHGDGYPQTAFVAFSVTSDLKVLFGTSKVSRKYGCIMSDPRVGINVTDAARRLSVQYEGEARLLSQDELTRYESDHYAKLPQSLKFKDEPGQVFFLVSPRLVRFSDCNPDPWQVTEHREF